MKINRGFIFLFLVIALLFCGCKDSDSGDESWSSIENNAKVTQVIFSGATQTVNFNNLSNNNIYLVKVNPSQYNVSAENTGGAAASIFYNVDSERTDSSIKGQHFFTPEAVAGFNANPPPNTNFENIPRNSMPLVGNANTIGNTHDFWLGGVLGDWLKDPADGGDPFVKHKATLQAIGDFCKIWVIHDGDEKKTITKSQAQMLADKFDVIYPAATNILGYEYGGGPSGNGGKDNDKRIQILIFYLDEGIGGYFWAKDFYDDSHPELIKEGIRSNMAEIIYINAKAVNEAPHYAYSTLVHELQHMINFNLKALRTGTPSSTWFDEMLSMMTEDAISSFLDISPSSKDHITRVRMPLFLFYYNYDGITNWFPDVNRVLISYSHKYAYGAYLLRNYGGAALLKEIISNRHVNEASITAALKAAHPGKGIDFEYTLMRFAEAMIYTAPLPAGAMSFDKTVSSKINGSIYTLHGFNIWGDFSDVVLDFGNDLTYKCDQPYIYDLSQADMFRHSFILHKDAGWQNKSGNFSITLNKPDDNGIEFFMMVK